MVVIAENIMPIAKKHFLIRQLDRGLITEAEYNEKIAPLEQEILIHRKERLEQAEEEMRKAFADVKNTTFGDGDIKRKIARMLIDSLREDFTAKEIKGVMRQGYKIMRTEVSDDDD